MDHFANMVIISIPIIVTKALSAIDRKKILEGSCEWTIFSIINEKQYLWVCIIFLRKKTN
jgi:hypothetical protein